MRVIRFEKTFNVPNSLLVDEIDSLEVHIKIPNKRGYSPDKSINKIFNLIDGYIKEAKHTSNIHDLYNLLYEEIEELFTFKARHKNRLAGNNIHIQVII